MFDVPQGPRRVRYENALERHNEALAEKELRFLKWVHPTKGCRKLSHKRMRAQSRLYHLLEGLRAGLPFGLYLAVVARGGYRDGKIY